MFPKHLKLARVKSKIDVSNINSITYVKLWGGGAGRLWNKTKTRKITLTLMVCLWPHKFPGEYVGREIEQEKGY